MNYLTYQPMKYLFGISTEAIFSVIAFVFFSYYIIRFCRRDRKIGWMLFSIIFGSLAGGRIWYYIDNWQGVSTLITLFDLTQAGLTSFGMIAGGIIAAILFLYSKKGDWQSHFAKNIDVIAIATALFVFIYRMGCFFYGCVPGTATRLPWGMFAINFGEHSGRIMHPTALYLSFSALMIFLFLHWYKDRKRFDGEVGLLFLLLYSFMRFWIEFLRDIDSIFLHLNEGQVLSIAVFACGLVLYVFQTWNKPMWLR